MGSVLLPAKTKTTPFLQSHWPVRSYVLMIPRYYERTSCFVIPPLHDPGSAGTELLTWFYLCFDGTKILWRNISTVLWPWSSLSKDKISDLIVVHFWWSQYWKVIMDNSISNEIWSYSFRQYCSRHNKVSLTFCWRCIAYDPTQAVSILWPFISRPWLGWQANDN